MPKCPPTITDAVIFDFADRLCYRWYVRKCKCGREFHEPVEQILDPEYTRRLCPSCYLINRAKQKERKRKSGT